MSAQLQRPPATTGHLPAHPPDALSLVGVSHSYPGSRGRPDLLAVENLTLSVAPGEILALVGPSGCGKSTLLELICALQSPRSGSLRCDPAVLMPQRDLLLPWLGALDNAALPIRLKGASRREAREEAGELFAQMGLEGFEHARPSELSGGMRQRVSFLRTLLSGKPILCLDEPFAALDAITRQEVQGWLAQALGREPRTVVLVTHDVEEAILLADRLAVLSPRPGRLLEILALDFPRPRSRTDPRTVHLRERALRALESGRAPRTGLDSSGRLP